MIGASVARRYAKALFQVGLEDGRWEAYGEELGRLDQALATSPELTDLFQNPAYGRDARASGAKLAVEKLGLSAAVSNLLFLLVDRQRASDIGSIAKAYASLVDAKVGRVRAVVTSATALAPELTSRLGATLAELTGKKILLDTKVDPALLGGVVAQVGSTVLDGSLRTQLESLRTQLHEARLSK